MNMIDPFFKINFGFSSKMLRLQQHESLSIIIRLPTVSHHAAFTPLSRCHHIGHLRLMFLFNFYIFLKLVNLTLILRLYFK